VNGPWKIDTREEKLEVHVTASNKESGLNLQVLSTEVCCLFYFSASPHLQASKEEGRALR
jgi:hypothetical protein